MVFPTPIPAPPVVPRARAEPTAVGDNFRAWTVRGQATTGSWKVIIGSILSGLGLLTYLTMYGYL